MEDSGSNQISGSTSCCDDSSTLNLASTSIDSSTSTDQERASSSTGQETDASHTSDDHETGSSMNEGTIDTSPNDIADTRDCEPVRPILKQFPKRMISGKLRGFSS